MHKSKATRIATRISNRRKRFSLLNSSLPPLSSNRKPKGSFGPLDSEDTRLKQFLIRIALANRMARKVLFTEFLDEKLVAVQQVFISVSREIYASLALNEQF